MRDGWGSWPKPRTEKDGVNTSFKESNSGVLGGKRRGRKRVKTHKARKPPSPADKPEKGGEGQNQRHRFLIFVRGGTNTCFCLWEKTYLYDMFHNVIA